MTGFLLPTERHCCGNVEAFRPHGLLPRRLYRQCGLRVRWDFLLADRGHGRGSLRIADRRTGAARREIAKITLFFVMLATSISVMSVAAQAAGDRGVAAVETVQIVATGDVATAQDVAISQAGDKAPGS